MRKDNRGMTLIELLVAITMLAVVVSPFLNTFLISARQNNKARETLRATTVAQNLMEGLKAFTVEQVCRQVNSDVADSKLYYPTYQAHQEFPDANGKTSWKDTAAEYEFQNTPSNKYTLGIQGIEEDGKLYDARILMDASGYSAINQDTDFSVDMMNDATDVVYSLTRENDNAIVNTASDQWKSTKRVFHIDITKKLEVSVGVTYTYPQVFGGITSKESTNKISITKGGLNNIYIMYYPNYNSTNAADPLDVFEIDYKADAEFNLFLVKQKYPGEQHTDNNYHVALNIKDTNSAGPNRKPRIALRTNILDDLYGNGNANQNSIRYEYQYGGNLSQDEIAEMLQFSDGKPQSISGNQKRKNLIYTTTVEIFPDGTYPNFDAAEPLARLSND